MRQSGPVALRTTARFTGLVALQQASEHGLLQMLRLGERHDPDPYERLAHVSAVRCLAGIAAGAAVAAVGRHGFSYYHAAAGAARHPRAVYMGAWTAAGGVFGLSATPLVEGVARAAQAGWAQATGAPR